jgi:hypothetical protein
MRVRAYDEKDLGELKRIHAQQGFGYAFPDLRNPLFVTKLVLEASREGASGERSCPDGAQPFAAQDKHCCAPTENDVPRRIVGAALLRVTSEAYLLLDPGLGTPRERWRWLLGLHAATEQDAARRGLEDVHAWLPPHIAAKFGKRLTKLGWIRDDAWTPYCKRLK